MATADKLSYLLETKEKIRDSINNEISLIDENTIFREYPNKIKSLSDTLKSYIPTDIKKGASVQISDAVPLNVKSLIIDGNSYQKTTKGINLFNYLENIGTIAGLTITTEGDYIVVNGTTANNYQLVIKDIDLTDMLEDGETYTLWQENDAKSSSSDTFPKTAIRLRTKHANGNYVYTRVTKSKVVSFSVDKSAFEEYCVDVVTPIVGEAYSNYKNKFMLVKGEYDENTIPIFEPYTGGIASPNPDYPQETEVIDELEIVQKGKNLLDTKNGLIQSCTINGLTYTNNQDGTFNIIGTATKNTTLPIIRKEYIPKTEIGEEYYFYSSKNYDRDTFNISLKLIDDSGTQFFIPKTVTTVSKEPIKNKEVAIYVTSGVTINAENVKLMLVKSDTIDENFEPHHKDEYSIDLQGNFIGKINDIKDTLDLATGVLTKKIGKVILDGSESINLRSNTSETHVKFIFPNILPNKIKNKVSLISSHFEKDVKANYYDGSINCICGNDASGYEKYLYISIEKTLANDIDSLKKWLSNNPVTIYYELAEPQIIQLDTLKIKMYDGTNNIELSSNLETEMKLEYYKNYKSGTNIIEQNEIIE